MYHKYYFRAISQKSEQVSELRSIYPPVIVSLRTPLYTKLISLLYVDTCALVPLSMSELKSDALMK